MRARARVQLSRVQRLATPRGRLQLEAMAALLVARVALRVGGFERLVALVERPPSRPETTEPRRSATELAVAAALHAALRQLPLRRPCLPAALAGHAMLRRRGVTTTLCWGATTAGGALTGHAWLEDAGVPVVGRPEGHRTLVRYGGSGT